MSIIHFYFKFLLLLEIIYILVIMGQSVFEIDINSG